MHVLMFGWEFPPRISGGLGRACDGITRGLAARGMKVRFVMPVPVGRRRHGRMRLVDNLLGDGADEAPDVSRRNDSIHLRPVKSLLTPYMTDETYRSLPARPLKSSAVRDHLYGPDILSEVDRYAVKARHVAEDGPVDIIHAHDWMTLPAALESRRITGKPVIFHVHSLESDRSGLRMNERIFAIERTGMMEADRIIAVSRYTAGKIVEQYGVPPGKIDVVHNAAGPLGHAKKRGMEKDPSRKYVLFLGRITGQKGPGYFIEAAARVIGPSPETHFIMAGEGDLLARMRAMVRDMKIEEHVHFTGFVSEAALGPLYRSCDLFVLPSISEPFGMTALEALSCGIPVIVSKTAGVLEVVPDCITVDPRNAGQMAEKIMALLNDGEGAKAMVEACRHRIRDLTWENVAGRLIDIYRRMTRHRGSVLT